MARLAAPPAPWGCPSCSFSEPLAARDGYDLPAYIVDTRQTTRQSSPQPAPLGGYIDCCCCYPLPSALEQQSLEATHDPRGVPKSLPPLFLSITTHPAAAVGLSFALRWLVAGQRAEVVVATSGLVVALEDALASEN